MIVFCPFDKSREWTTQIKEGVLFYCFRLPFPFPLPQLSIQLQILLRFFGFHRCSFGMFCPWNVTMLHPTAMFVMICYSILLMLHWTVSRFSFSPPVRIISSLVISSHSLLHFRHIFFMAVVLTTGQFIFSWDIIGVLLLFCSGSSFHSWSPLLLSM